MKRHISRFGHTTLCGRKVPGEFVTNHNTPIDPTCKTCIAVNKGKRWLF